MALPKYLYIVHPNDEVVTYYLNGEDDDHYIATAPFRPGVKLYLHKKLPVIVGSGDEPYPLPDGSKVMPPLKTIWITPGQQLTAEEQAVPTKIIDKWSDPPPDPTNP